MISRIFFGYKSKYPASRLPINSYKLFRLQYIAKVFYMKNMAISHN